MYLARKIVAVLALASFFIVAAVSVNVVSASTQAPSTSFTINGSGGPLSMIPGNATFSWSSSDATDCTASGDPSWSGSLPASGSEQVYADNEKSGETIYTVTCGGGKGINPASASVTVFFTQAPSTSFTIPTPTSSSMAPSTQFSTPTPLATSTQATATNNGAPSIQALQQQLTQLLTLFLQLLHQAKAKGLLNSSQVSSALKAISQ